MATLNNCFVKVLPARLFVWSVNYFLLAESKAKGVWNNSAACHPEAAQAEGSPCGGGWLPAMARKRSFAGAQDDMAEGV
jgi:hypothetical protein